MSAGPQTGSRRESSAGGTRNRETRIMIGRRASGGVSRFGFPPGLSGFHRGVWEAAGLAGPG